MKAAKVQVNNQLKTTMTKRDDDLYIALKKLNLQDLPSACLILAISTRHGQLGIAISTMLQAPIQMFVNVKDTDVTLTIIVHTKRDLYIPRAVFRVDNVGRENM